MLLLKQNTTKKGWIDKNKTKLDISKNSKKYKVETIYNSTVYTRKSANHLPKLYYLVF